MKAVLAAVGLTSAVAASVHVPTLLLSEIEALECEVISLAARSGDIRPIATAAPSNGWLDGTALTGGDSSRKQAAADLRRCSNLGGRLSETGAIVSRVVFDEQRLRAVVDIQCGPTYLVRRHVADVWRVEAQYTSVHRCDHLP